MHEHFHSSVHKTYVCTIVKMVGYTVTVEEAVGMASATANSSVAAHSASMLCNGFVLSFVCLFTAASDPGLIQLSPFLSLSHHI